MPLRLNRQQLRELIEQIEAGGGAATVLRRELEALGPEVRHLPPRRNSRIEEEELTTEERLNDRVGDLFPNGIPLDRIVEMDRNHSLKELRAMCIGAGLSPTGDKKEMAAKLLVYQEPATDNYIGWGI